MSQVTVRAVLFGQADAAAALARTPGWRGVIDGLGGALSAVSTGGRQLVHRELSSAVSGLLGLDLRDVLIGGWRRHRALQSAAHATQANPQATEVVTLATHQITTAHRPYVDIIVNGAKVGAVHFDLALTLDIDAMVGTVRQARLVALQGGRCAVTAWLGCEGRELVSRQAVIDPVVTVALGDGIALLQDDGRRAPA